MAFLCLHEIANIIVHDLGGVGVQHRIMHCRNTKNAEAKALQRTMDVLYIAWIRHDTGDT